VMVDPASTTKLSAVPRLTVVTAEATLIKAKIATTATKGTVILRKVFMKVLYHK